MKQLFLIYIFIVFYLIPLHATDYYFSSSSTSATEDGSQTNPYKSLSALGSITLAAGDNVYFKAGDVFRGQMTVTRSGASGAPITFTTYGGASHATISGAEKLTSWSSSGGLYTATSATTIRNFFVNDAEATLARYPNSGFLTVDNATTSTMTDAAVSNAAGYWNGASICIHTCQWAWEKTTIASYSSGSFTFGTPTLRSTPVNYGYFLYNKLEECDTEGEWYFGSNTLYYKTATDPNSSGSNYEATLYDAGIQLGNSFTSVSNINISNLTFDKQYEAGIWFNNSSNQNITITNCSFYRSYKHGISTTGSNHSISNCYFEACDASGVTINGSATTVSDCNFYDIGKYRNSGIGGETNLTAIKCNFASSCHIHHNTIDRAGYCGISADGSNHIVERNIVKNCMLLNNDGGGLKAFGVASTGTVFRNNIVSDTHGNTEGTFSADFKTPGIYLDWSSNNITIQNNTIYNCSQKGIFLNGATNNVTVSGNMVYGGEYGIDFNAASHDNAMHSQNVQNNVFFARTTTGVNVRQSPNRTSGTYTFGTINNNYYFQPYNANRVGFRVPSSYYSLSNWQALAEGFDANTKGSFVSWTYPTDYSEIFINQTDNVITQNISGKYFDLDGNDVCSSFTLQPYTSRVLINANASCAMPIELRHFSGKSVGKNALLEWETANESGVRYFDIEKSLDGKSFSTIGSSLAHNTPSVYRLLDEQFTTSAYYRLKTNDLDGSIHLSNTVFIPKNQTPNVKIHQITEGSIWIETDLTIEQVLLTNLLGQVLKTSQQSQFDFFEIPTGIYLVCVKTTEDWTNLKVFKK